MPQTGKDEAFHVLERIRNNISFMALPAQKDGPAAKLTISTGIAMYPECGESIESIIVQADKALYFAKTNGKNKTVSWNPGIDFKPAKISVLDETGIRSVNACHGGKLAEGLGPSGFRSEQQNPDEPFKGFAI